MQPETITLPFKKETKGMFQFQNDKASKKGDTIPTVYVKKEFFPNWMENQVRPKAIKITFEEA